MMNENFLLTLLFIIVSCCVLGIPLLRISQLLMPLRFEHPIVKALLLYCFQFAASTFVYPGEISGSIGSLLLLASIFLIFFRGMPSLQISAIFLFFPIMTAISYMVENIGYTIWVHCWNSTDAYFYQTFMQIVFRWLRALPWWGVYYMVRSWLPDASKLLNKKMWLMIDGISLASFTGIISIIYVLHQTNAYLAYPACIACMITGLGICWLCARLSNSLRTEMEIKILKYQHSYYEEVEANQKRIQHLRHDLKNHLSVLSACLDENHIDQAKDYLAKLHIISIPSVHRYCHNQLLNALLNRKVQQAEALDIQCAITLYIPEDPFIDSVRLCSLFSNAFDNALDACKLIPKGLPRFIDLKAKFSNEGFSFMLENSSSKAPYFIGEKIRTTKSDSHHGFGLSSIDEVVSLYHGSMTIDADISYFRLTLFIPECQSD